MSALPLEKHTPSATDVVPLTVDQYHQMVEAGILPEGAPIELLDGLLIQKDRGAAMTTNPRHASVLDSLNWLLAAELPPRGGYLRLQSPLTLPPHHEPEPDAAIVRGKPQDYRDHHPLAADVCCVIEVADSSLERDRTLKQRIYATAGIDQYVLINLTDRRVELFEEPAHGTYRLASTLTEADSLYLRTPTGEPLEVPAVELLS